MRISGPELTAIDLVFWANRVGGLNRVLAILAELSDSLNVEKLEKLLTHKFPIASLQRLGYIFENILQNHSLADSLFYFLNEKPLFRVPLNQQSGGTGFLCNNRWKVIENANIKKEL